jgi:hypothetical protein
LRPASTSSSAPTPDEFRCAAFRGKHPAQKKQIARLRCFRIDAERLRRRREIEARSELDFLARRLKQVEAMTAEENL